MVSFKKSLFCLFSPIMSILRFVSFMAWYKISSVLDDILSLKLLSSKSLTCIQSQMQLLYPLLKTLGHPITSSSKPLTKLGSQI